MNAASWIRHSTAFSKVGNTPRAAMCCSWWPKPSRSRQLWTRWQRWPPSIGARTPTSTSPSTVPTVRLQLPFSSSQQLAATGACILRPRSLCAAAPAHGLAVRGENLPPPRVTASLTFRAVAICLMGRHLSAGGQLALALADCRLTWSRGLLHRSHGPLLLLQATIAPASWCARTWCRPWASAWTMLWSSSRGKSLTAKAQAPTSI